MSLFTVTVLNEVSNGLILCDRVRSYSSPRPDPVSGASTAESISLCGGNRQLTDCAHSCQVALTGLSPALCYPFSSLSLKPIVVTAAVQIQIIWSSVCRRHAQTNSASRIHVDTKPPSLPLSYTHPHKQTCDMLRDPSLTGQTKLPVF